MNYPCGADRFLVREIKKAEILIKSRSEASLRHTAQSPWSKEDGLDLIDELCVCSG